MAHPSQTSNKQHAAAPSRTIPVFRPWAPSVDAIAPYLHRIDGSRWYSNFGPLNTELEERLASRFGEDVHVVTFSSGTMALTAALRARAPNGGLCIMPAWTFVATAHAAIAAGLQPYLIDVDPTCYALTQDGVRAAIKAAPSEVTAIVPVAPFGDASAAQGWRAFENELGVPVVIDAAAAFDAANNAETPLIVSTHATKALGAGEGGFLATKDKALADEVRALSSFGFKGARISQMPAFNAKLSEYHAAVALAALDAWPDTRRRYMRSARVLRAAFAKLEGLTFQQGWGEAWINTIAMARVPSGTADRLQRHLAKHGVDTRHWWNRGLHREPAFRKCLRAPNLSATNELANAMLGLPFSIDFEKNDAQFAALIAAEILRMR